MFSRGGDMAQEVRAVVRQSEGRRFDPTLGVSKCPWARHPDTPGYADVSGNVQHLVKSICIVVSIVTWLGEC